MCAEPNHMSGCPLPAHDLRNGHLNYMAFSLFLFIREDARDSPQGNAICRLRFHELPNDNKLLLSFSERRDVVWCVPTPGTN